MLMAFPIWSHLLPALSGRAGHFCPPLRVATQAGLYLHPYLGAERAVSEGIACSRYRSRLSCLRRIRK